MPNTKHPARMPLAALILLLVAWLAAPAATARAAALDGGLKVQSLLPQGRAERVTQVVARFDRPMVPLGQAAQAPETAPLKLDPRPAGSFRWLDPQTLAYILDPPLTGATLLSLTVPAGIHALDGATLGRAVSGQVSTPPVEVLRLEPAADQPLAPKPTLRLVMSQAVDLPGLTRALKLTVGGRAVPVEVTQAPTPQWQPERERLARAYLIRPVAELPPALPVRLALAPGVMPASGNLPSPKGFGAEYTSYGPLAVKKLNLDKATGGGYNPAAPLIIEFNNPVSPALAWKHLKFDPPVPAPEAASWTDPTPSLYLELKLKPRTTYKLSLEPGLTDAYGTRLAQGRSWTLAMGDLPPMLTLPGEQGVLEANGPPLYPLKVRNVPEVRAAARFIPPDQVAQILNAEASRAWDQNPPRPEEGQPGVRVTALKTNAPPNQLVLRPLDLPKLLGRSPRGGLVLLDLRTAWPDDQGKMRQQIRRSLVQVTGLGLSLKLGSASGAVWVTRLADAKPLEGVNLELRDRENRVLWQSVSDAKGLARLPGVDPLKPAPDKKQPWRNPIVYLLATHGEDFAVLDAQWTWQVQAQFPGGFYQAGPASQPPLKAHALTQLPLYQPGQTVRLAVYLRQPGPNGLAAVAGRKLQVLVRDSYGNVVHRLNGTSSAYGSLAGEFGLADQARLGVYYMVVKDGKNETSAGQFRVASFRPPDFRVGLKAPKSLFSGQAGQAGLEAAYLFGAPLAGGKAAYRAAVEDTWFAPQRLDGYAVGDLPLPGTPSQGTKELLSRQLDLDAKGRAVLPVPAAQAPPGQPMRLNLEASVSDAAQRSVSDQASVLVHSSALYLGLKTPLLAEANKPCTVEVAAATHDNQAAPPAPVKLIAYRQFWETVRERGPGGFYHYLGKARREKVWETGLAAGAWPLTAEFTPPEAGTYVLVAEAADAAGRPTRSAVYLYASGAGVAGWQRFDDHRLEIEPGLSELKPGDTARLLIKNPFAKATALITLERQGVRRLMVREVEGPAPVVELPVSAADAPGVYAGVLLVRGRAAPPTASDRADLGKPQVRIGYAVLKVSDPATALEVKVEPDRKKYRPGEEVAVKVAVSRAGQPLKAEVCLLAVDERVLVAAGGGDNYDPRPTFDELAPLAVSTMDLRTQVVGQRFAGQKGESALGGGSQGEQIRRDFHPAVFWLAQAETDDQGVLQARFKLPDSLTAYRIVAVAADQAAGFGLGSASVTASQPLQILSALPRFLIEGDRLSARVLLQNFSGQAATATVKAEAQGWSLEGSAVQEINLPPGATVPVAFTLLPKEPGQGVLTVKAEMGEAQNTFKDAARFSLPVLPATELTSTAAAGILDPAAGQGQAVVPLELPVDALPGRGGLAVTLSPSLAAAARPAALLLEEYPWDCLEQRLSRAAAWALALEDGNALGLAPGKDYADRVRAVLARTAQYQTGGGGLAFWPGMERSDYYLTAYALFAAKRLGSGFALDKEVTSRAMAYLERGLRRGPKPAAGDLAARTAQALAVCALAERGRATPAMLDAAAARPEGLGPFGCAALLEASHALKQPAQAARLLKALEAMAEVTAQELSFGGVDPGGLKLVLGSRLRGNAMALWVLARRAPDYPRLDGLARWVARRLADSPYLSTQEAAFGLWGLAAWLGRDGGKVDLTVAARLAGRELVEHRFDAPGDPPLSVEVRRALLEPGQRQELTLTANGQGRPLYTARLSWAPNKPPAEAVNAGLSVARYFTPEGPPALGREVTMTVSVSAPQTRHQVLVKVPWPAGLEPPEPARGAPLEADAWASPWRWRELRKDALVLYAPRLAPGVYTYSLRLTAVAPGRFLVRPARAEEMYAPEVFGASTPAVMEVR